MSKRYNSPLLRGHLRPDPKPTKEVGNDSKPR
jgi:hypothetical protein